MTDLFKLPTDVSDQFSEAYINPNSVSFAAKYKAPDGSIVPILYLSSGMKLAVSDEMFADVVNRCNVILPGTVPDAFKNAWDNWPEVDKNP